MNRREIIAKLNSLDFDLAKLRVTNDSALVMYGLLNSCKKIIVETDDEYILKMVEQKTVKQFIDEQYKIEYNDIIFYKSNSYCEYTEMDGIRLDTVPYLIDLYFEIFKVYKDYEALLKCMSLQSYDMTNK